MRYETFEDAAYAVMTLKEDSREWREALAYVVELAPPWMRKIFDEKFAECFPDLKPTHRDAEGRPYVSAERMKEYFGVTDEQMEEIVSEHPEIVTTAEGLTRVQ